MIKDRPKLNCFKVCWVRSLQFHVHNVAATWGLLVWGRNVRIPFTAVNIKTLQHVQAMD